MPTPVPTPQASVARGLSIVAVVAALLLALQLAWAAAADVPSSADAEACERPVEIVDPSGARLGCAESETLAACPPLHAGDRARLADGACSVTPGAMRGGWRLLRGLGLRINRASVEELMLLDGVGPSIAAAIVEERGANGPFATVEGLERVRGIGPATVERLRPYVTVAEAK